MDKVSAFDEKGFRTVVALIGSASLNFASIAAGTGTEDLTISVPGAAVGDPVSLGLPAGINAGLLFTPFVSAADTVTVRATNISAGAIDAAAGTFTVSVSKVA